MPAMTAVAEEMLELAELIAEHKTSDHDKLMFLSPRGRELIVIALRESALSRNAKVTEKMI